MVMIGSVKTDKRLSTNGITLSARESSIELERWNVDIKLDRILSALIQPEEAPNV